MHVPASLAVILWEHFTERETDIGREQEPQIHAQKCFTQ